MIEVSRRSAMLGTAAAVVTVAAPQSRAQAGVEKAAIDRLLQQAVETKQVPGVVAIAVTDKAPLYQGAFGKRSLAADGASMTMDSVFWIASMTKAITSTAAMQQVERGKLSLEQPISDVLPELAAPQVLEGFDRPAHPSSARPSGRSRCRHLLTHTAGFTYNIWDATRRATRRSPACLASSPARTTHCAPRLAFDPGERWEYGINIDWGGQGG